MTEKEVYQNTLVFLERVQTTGPQEAAYLVECFGFYQNALNPPKGEEKPLKKSS